MAQPGSKPAWVPSDDPAKVIEPSVSKKNTGWASEEKPPFQYFNWFWNIMSKWINWFNGTRKYNIVISGESTEADFSTLAAYIAGSPSVGDRVLVKNDQTLTATMSLPADIEITMVKGKKFSLSTVFTPVMNIGNRTSCRGDWEIETGQTGVIAKAVVFNGDDAFLENFRVENITSGTVTAAFEVAAGKIGNKAQGRSTNTGAGAITNDLVDSSTNTTNLIVVRTDTGQIGTQTVTTADNALSLGGFLANLYAKLVSPAFTGTPTGPTAAPGTSTIQLATTAFSSAAALATLPIGSEAFWPSATPPTDWMEEDGSAISRTTYATLFAQISTDYGIGDGSTTFNLPDPRGRAVRVWDHAAGVDPDAAGRTDRGDGTAGDNVGTNQADAEQGHIHYNGIADDVATDFVYGLTTNEMPGSATRTIGNNVEATTNQGLTSTPKTDGSSGTPRTSTESRMLNTNRMMIIKVS